MATDGAPLRSGHVALSELLDEALRSMEQERTPPQPGQEPPKAPPPMAGDGFLFSGNRHESVPRALFHDRRLTPLERNAWQVFRMRLSGDGVTAFPTYEELRPFLASMPCLSLASHETVARALTVLRLTRWLSLVRRRRDPRTGRMLGNLYVLHDEPLSPFEAIQLDAEYLGLVGQSLSHAAKSVQIVGVAVLQEIADDPMLRGRSLPTRLQVLAQRMAAVDGSRPSYPQQNASYESEDGSDAPLRNRDAPSTESEPGPEPAPIHSLRNPKTDSTVSTVSMKVPHARAVPGLRLPPRLDTLKEIQRNGVLVALQQVDQGLRQPVLDEWDARCRDTTVRNPAGYLFGIIQKAIRGEFKAWAGEGGSTGPPDPVAATAQAPQPSPPARHPAGREAAMAYLARIRASKPRGR